MKVSELAKKIWLDLIYHFNKVTQSISLSTVIDCVVSGWGPWSDCDTNCGSGSMVRSRRVVQAPAHGGRHCPSLVQRRACQEHTGCSEDSDIPLRGKWWWNGRGTGLLWQILPLLNARIIIYGSATKRRWITSDVSDRKNELGKWQDCFVKGFSHNFSSSRFLKRSLESLLTLTLRS